MSSVIRVSCLPAIHMSRWLAGIAYPDGSCACMYVWPNCAGRFTERRCVFLQPSMMDEVTNDDSDNEAFGLSGGRRDTVILGAGRGGDFQSGRNGNRRDLRVLRVHDAAPVRRPAAASTRAHGRSVL